MRFYDGYLTDQKRSPQCFLKDPPPMPDARCPAMPDAMDDDAGFFAGTGG